MNDAQFIRNMNHGEIAALSNEDVVAIAAVHDKGIVKNDYARHVVNYFIPNVDISDCLFEVLTGNARDSSLVTEWLEEKRLLKTLFYATSVFGDAGEGSVGVTIVIICNPKQKQGKVSWHFSVRYLEEKII